MQLRKLFLFIALIPGLGLSQGQIKLDFGSAGEREVWISDSVSLPPSTLKATEATLDLPVQGGKTDKLYVWDRKTGNVAAKPVGEVKGTWKLTPQDFQLVGKVTVRVEHEGDRVAVAFVKLKDGNGERDSQIDASKNGEAIFFGVQPGNVQVTVKYNSKGVDAEPAQQSFVLNPKRAEIDPLFIVSLTQEVETVGSSEAGSSKEPEKSGSGEAPAKDGDKTEPAPAKGGSVIGSILVYLLALGAAGAAIWFGLKYMKDNQDKVKGQLQKIGVQVPDPQDPAQQDPGPAPVPVAPAPPQKIILDDADPNIPSPISSIPMTPSVPSVSVSQPSFVMENGDVFPLPDGETTVGREAGNGLSLVTENTVSRKHAAIVKDGANVLVRDLGSSNGTFVNGVKVASDTVLRPGDQVQFGEVRFRFEA